MKTNFFEHIAGLQLAGDLNMVISNHNENKLTVSIYLNNKKAGENAGKTIIPLILNGTAEELDNGFFEAVTQPLQQTSGLLVNIATYAKGLEKAKQTAKSDHKTKSNTNTRQNGEEDGIEVSEPQVSKEDKRKAYTDILRQIVELDNSCKYEEALALLPSVSEYPDREAEIEKRKADLERKNQQKQLLWNE